MNEKRIAKLVEFGKGGDTVYLGKGSTISGYGDPDRPHAADPHSYEGKNLLIPDGTPAVDVRAAVDTDEGFKWVFHGPLVNVDLPENKVETCPEPDPLMAVAMAENQFGQLLAVHVIDKAARPKQPGPLDSVPISVFVSGWRDHGARIGHYQGGRIVWES